MSVILSRVKFEAGEIARIQEVSPSARVIIADGEEEALAAAPEAEIILGSVTQDMVRRAKNLRWIQVPFAGVDKILFPEIKERSILLTNARGMHGKTIAEHVFALLLAFTRRLPMILHNQYYRTWTRLKVIEVNGKTMGIVGLGGIGQEIARRAKAFDLTVLGIKRNPSPVPYVDEVLPPEELPSLLRRSDFVVLSLPLTKETYHLIGAKELAYMKKTAFLFNISRGAIIDELALIEALQAARIAGAGLDVFEQEPLPKDSPLYNLPNVLLTPHVAGTLENYKTQVLAIFLENLQRYLRGEPLLNLVDLEKGY